MRALLFIPLGCVSLLNAGVEVDSACWDANSKAVELFGQQAANRAEYLLQQALIRVERAPNGALCAGITLNNLAVFAQKNGKLNEAEKYAQLAMREFEKDPQSQSMLVRPLELLVGVYVERNLPGTAKPFLARLDTITEIGITDKAVIAGLRASVFLALGDFQSAERSYLVALQDWASAPPRSPAGPVPDQINLARLYIGTGRYAEAESLLNSSAKLVKGQAYDGACETVQILDSFGSLLIRQGKVDAALQSSRSAIQFAHRCPITVALDAQLYRDYAAILRVAHRKSEAREFEAKARLLEPATEPATIDLTQLAAKANRRSGGR